MNDVSHPEKAVGDRSQLPLTVRVPEACRLTGIGRSKLYELIKVGEIETIKVGHMTLIPMASLENFLSRHRKAGCGD